MSGSDKSDDGTIVAALRATLRENGVSVSAPLLAEFLRASLRFAPGTPISAALADGMIAQIDECISLQLSAVLHHEAFRKLETSWRSLEFLVERIDFRQNILLQYISISRDDLLADFDDAPQITLSGFYKHVYIAEYGQFGGRPIGAIVANYELGASPTDIRLLTHASAVAAMAHAIFIAGAGRSFFGLSSWDQFPSVRDFHALFEMPNYAQWRSFRDSDDSRYAALTLPCFLFRPPYGPGALSADTFAFTETQDNSDDLCWGNAAFALADRLADSFARYRWCVNIVGPEGGGLVENFPSRAFRTRPPGLSYQRIPTQILLSEQREFELSEEGFIGLTFLKGRDSAVFFSATSCQSARVPDGEAENRENTINRRLGIQIPYIMIMNRLAHYIKVLQRENLGQWKTRQIMESELNKWLNQYVTEMDDPDPVTRSRRPLRHAELKVTEIPNNPACYAVTVHARPHFKFMGANFTLSLTGKLDREG
ncbi:MAG: type VI secretion system contractile sheath large subunit [Candidatus Accumulibacter sp.]|jgi:type VI secretion system protein ImpC|nr:type VI secretion system contractile sheath large subunit [Accumulibacter sp.]